MECLLPQHQKLLTDSAISQSVIAARGYYAWATLLTRATTNGAACTNQAQAAEKGKK